MAKTAAKKAMIRARAGRKLKAKAEATLQKLGLTPSTAINLFYQQIVLQQGLPFQVRVPNRATRRAMRDAEVGRNLIRAESLEELLGKLDAADK